MSDPIGRMYARQVAALAAIAGPVVPPRPRVSEHTDAARLEATRDAIRTGTAPRSRVEGEAVAEIVAMEWDGLRPDEMMRHLALDLLDARKERDAIEVAVRKLCPLDNNEGYEDEDGDAVVYRCINEDGDAFIETESLAEAVEGMVASYDRVCGAFEAKCEEVARLTAEVERLTKLAQLGEKVIAVALVKERFKVAGAELFKQTFVPGQYSNASDAYAKAQQELREAVEAAIICPDCGGAGRFTDGGEVGGYHDLATGEWCGPEFCDRCDGTGKAAALALPTPAPEATE